MVYFKHYHKAFNSGTVHSMFRKTNAIFEGCFKLSFFCFYVKKEKKKKKSTSSNQQIFHNRKIFWFFIPSWYTIMNCCNFNHTHLWVLKTELQSIYKEIWESCFVGTVAVDAFSSAYSPLSTCISGYLLIGFYFNTILNQKESLDLLNNKDSEKLTK